MCSLTDICTSAGMSGDVWLIFTAASRKPREWGSFSLSAMLPLQRGLRRVPGGASAEEGLEASFFLQGVQRSFQKRKRKTATRATPHTITTTARRLTEVPALGEPGGEGQRHAGWGVGSREGGSEREHTQGTKTEEEKRTVVRTAAWAKG